MTASTTWPLPVTDATHSKVQIFERGLRVKHRGALDVWAEHFELDEGIVVGLTPKGRATVHCFA